MDPRLERLQVADQRPWVHAVQLGQIGPSELSCHLGRLTFRLGVVPSMTEPSHAVFLSYASQDALAAQRICEAFRAADIEVWFDCRELR